MASTGWGAERGPVGSARRGSSRSRVASSRSWRRASIASLCALAFVGARAGAEIGDPAERRRVEFIYEVEVTLPPADAGTVELFVPLPLDTPHQRVLETSIESPMQGEIGTDAVYGNRFWRTRLDAAATSSAAVGDSVRVTLTHLIERKRFSQTPPAADRSRPLDPEERRANQLFLSANERVVVDHPILDPIRKELRALAASDAPAARARAIYDWVVDNVEYKKIGTGWGNGDTFWACTERYGNCTDFHSLLISLARSEGIPARFEMGFPLPLDRGSGQVGGYHCWVEIFLPESGWIPLDASEASKDPARRELFYGTHPADRIHFTTGRDLTLGEHHRGPALNYFIYPHLEVAGVSVPGRLKQRFRYRDQLPAAGAGAGGS